MNSSTFKQSTKGSQKKSLQQEYLKEEEAIHQSVKQIYTQLGIKGVVRIDFMVQAGVPYVIEVNTTPGMSDQSIIPQQTQYCGMTLSELFDGIINNS